MKRDTFRAAAQVSVLIVPLLAGGPVLRAESILERLEKRQSQNNSIKAAVDMFPELPASGKVGTLDCELNYAGCGGAPALALSTIAGPDVPAILQRLAALSGNAAFGCADYLAVKEDSQSQIRCRFVRESDHPAEAWGFPRSWNLSSTADRKTRVWIAASVRIGANGLPLEVGAKLCPVAIESGAALSLVGGTCDEWFPLGQFDAQDALVGQKLFYFPTAQNVQPTVRRTMQIFLDELEAVFSKPPLSADRAVDVAIKDGEWVAERIRQKSEVIGRQNWLPSVFNSAYETSTYTFKWFCSDRREYDGILIPGQKGCVSREGRNVFASLNQVICFSSDGVRYHESVSPSSQDERYLGLYKQAIAEEFKKALFQTCYKRFPGRGMLSNGTCEIRGDVQ